MGENHYWYGLRRVICVAVALWLFACAFSLASAFATEETTVAATVANSNASETLSIANTSASPDAAEVIDIAETVASDDAAAGFYFPESDEIFDLILRLQRKRDVLAPTIIGLQKNFDYYLPVMEIANAVKFPAQADLAKGIIRGSFINSQNTFTIDAINRRATSAGETYEIPEGSIILRDLGQGLGDIYIAPEILNKIWPLALEVDFGELTVFIQTRQKLPFELERERKKRQDALEDKENEGKEKGPDLEYIENGYKTLTPPVFTIAEALSWNAEQEKLQNNLSVTGEGDVLGTTADYTANIISTRDNPVDLESLRMRFTRRDYGTGTLPLGLKLVQAGDISAKPSPLIEKIISGRGAYISTDPEVRNQTFDEITVEGISQPGWEVEIYRGSELLDFGTVNERGEYRFENIPLNYGNNTVRVVLYGPQGQIEERIEDYSIGRNMLSPGETNFEAGIIDEGERLIEIDEEANRSDNVLSKNIRINRGISHWLTGFLTATETPTRGGNKRYITVGGNILALGGRGQIEAYKDLNGGQLLDTRFARNFAGINVGMRASVFKNFESTVAGFGDNAKTFEGEFRAGKSFILPFGQLDLNGSTTYIKHKDGDTSLQSRSVQSISLSRFLFSNVLNTSLINGNLSSNTGSFSVHTGLGGNWRFRSALDYTLYPTSDLDKLRTELRHSDPKGITASVNVTQGIRNTEETEIGVGASYDFGTFLGGVDMNWSKNEGADVILRANTTFGPDGEDKNYIFSTDYKGYNTALKVRLYHDKDMDGTFSVGDEPIKGGKILINGRMSQRSDENGFIDELGAGAPGLAAITIDVDSLPDPFLAPFKDGYKTLLRPGTKPFIDFALIQTGAIDGNVRFEDGRPVPGLRIQLISGDGGVPIRDTSTAYDGFYSFEYVRPGTYTVQVDPTHVVNVPPRTVSVTSEEIFAYGEDLTLLEQAAEVSAADEADGDSGRVAHTYHAPVAEGTLQPAPYSSGDGVQSVVRSVRFGGTPDKARLVLDLSGSANYRIAKEKNKSVFYIDLPDTAWDVQGGCTPTENSLFANCEATALPEGGTRLRLEGRENINVFYNALLPPGDGKGHRLYIDFMRVVNQ